MQGNHERYKQGVCAACGQKSAYIFAENPSHVFCDRENRCGYKMSTRELYPDLFESYSQRFELQMQEDPKAIARAYLLEARGLDQSRWASEFTQETIAANGAYSPTIRFQLSAEASWERVIENVDKIGKKANFIGSYKGLAWKPAYIDYANIAELWITEGIFDAIALNENGIAAISAISCHNFPQIELDKILAVNPSLKIVIALDAGNAGEQSARKWFDKLKAQFEHVAIALPDDKKHDWNDYHKSKRLSEQDQARYLTNGALLVAKTASEKAKILWASKNSRAFYFEHHHKTYWFAFDDTQYFKAYDDVLKSLDLDADALSDEERNQVETEAFNKSNTITEILNCQADVLYFQRDELTEESFYYMALSNDYGHANSVFLPKQLSSAGDFKTKVMGSLAGAIYTGNGHQLNAIYKDKTQFIKTVKTIPFMGYAKEFGAYIFNQYAVKNGVVYEINSEDYFQLNDINVKSTFSMAGMHPQLNYRKDWMNDFITAYSIKGVVALAFWFGSLFAEQIRAEHGSFPFLEITGEAGAGKSSLLEFLWKLVGRTEYEGFNPTTSSMVSRTRNFVQVANLPVVLLEGDTSEESKHKQAKFQFEDLKALFNGRSPRATGVKNNRNDTHEPPFRGSIVISQNAKVGGSQAILSRICYLHFDKSHHSPASRPCANRLAKIECDSISGFLFEALKQEKTVMNIINSNYDTHRNRIMNQSAMITERLGVTHGLLNACLDAFYEVIKLPFKTYMQAQSFIDDMAVQREQDLLNDPADLEQFWDTFEYLESIGQPVNHCADRDKKETIALSLNQFYDSAKLHNQALPDIKRIKELIRKSRRYSFKEYKNQHSPSIKRQIKCYIFERNKK